MAAKLDQAIADRLWAEVSTPHAVGPNGKPLPFREWSANPSDARALLAASNADPAGMAYMRTRLVCDNPLDPDSVRLHSGYIRELLEAV